MRVCQANQSGRLTGKPVRQVRSGKLTGKPGQAKKSGKLTIIKQSSVISTKVRDRQGQASIYHQPIITHFSKSPGQARTGKHLSSDVEIPPLIDTLEGDLIF